MIDVIDVIDVQADQRINQWIWILFAQQINGWLENELIQADGGNGDGKRMENMVEKLCPFLLSLFISLPTSDKFNVGRC